MTTQTIKGGLRIPHYKRTDTSPEGTSTSGVLLDASGEKMGWVLRVPKTGTLHKVWFRTGTVTTGDTLKVSFQDVDLTTGMPDETVDQYRTVVVADGNDDTGFTTGILSSDGTDGGTKRSVTVGDILAVVVEYNSYVAGNMYIHNYDGLGSGGFDIFPYITTKLGGGAWAKINSGASLPALALEYSDGTYEYFGSFPFVSMTNNIFDNATTPDEYALRFSLPFPCRIAGIGAAVDADGDCDFVLYEGTTARATKSWDKDIRASTSGGIMEVFFDTPYTIAANTVYYASLKPTSTSDVALRYGTVSAAAIMDCLEGGQNLYLATRTDAGAWSTTDTDKRPSIWVIIDGFDDATGGGAETIKGNPTALLGGYLQS